MSATIFRHEFLAKIRSMIIWSIGAAALLIIWFSMFPSFADEASVINDLWSRFPPELRAAFGLDKMNMATVLGFMGFLLTFVQLFLAIQAGNYGFGLVSVEENELTADFLLTKPVSRSQVLISKLLAALSTMLLTTLAVWVCTFIAIALYRGGREYDSNTLILILLGLPVFQVSFLGVGLVVSLIVKRVRSVTPYSLGLAFGAYVLAAFSGMLSDVKLEYLTPFKHFDPSYIINHSAWNTPLVLLNVAVTVVSLAVSYWLYIRRDIPAVS
jgi:ABC-2 type transport system permease protein